MTQLCQAASAQAAPRPLGQSLMMGWICRTSVEQLHYDVPSQQLLVLNSGLAYGEAERSNIMAWDLETQVETSKTVEFMEAYALCCFAPMSEAAGPPLYVAGAVYAGALLHYTIRMGVSGWDPWPAQPERDIWCCWCHCLLSA